VGLARGPAGEVILNPDEEVQARIRLVFEKFRAHPLGRRRDAVPAGSAFASASLPKSRPCPPTRVIWQPARTSAILDILHNPAYAGAYVYGRKQLDPARRTEAASEWRAASPAH
jgi:hypothetical protein